MRKPPRLIALFASSLAAAGMAFAVQAAAPAYACACGAFAPPNGLEGPIAMNSEASIITLTGGQETIEMRLGVDTLTKETGLILPTPTPAQVTLGDAADYRAISAEMTPEVRTVEDWWGWPGLGNGVGGAAPGSPRSPTVLDQVQLGPIQATTLAADDAAGLTAWLKANKYGVRASVSALFERYVNLGWSFVALKLTGETPLDGDLAPLTFTFASDRIVYPMALSQAATTAQHVFLYVFADHKQDIRFVNGSSVDGQVTWARAVRSPSLQQRGAYLTAFTLDFYDPTNQIKDDLLLTKSADDTEVGTVLYQTEHIALFGVPMGMVLIFLGLIALTAVFAVFLRVVAHWRERRAAASSR